MSNKNIPEPNTPAKPVPDPKCPTIVLGNPLQKPRVVLSPSELAIPNNRAANIASQNDRLPMLKVQAIAIIKKPRDMRIVAIPTLERCCTLIKYFAFISLVTLLNRIRQRVNMDINSFSLKISARLEDAVLTITYPLLLNRPMTKSEKKNLIEYTLSLSISFIVSSFFIFFLFNES